MANKGRVIIKINSKNEDRIESKINQQEMIMEWDVKRILVAIGVLLFIILLPIYIYNVDSYEPVSEKPLNKIQDIAKPVAEIPVNFFDNNLMDEDVQSIESRIKEKEKIINIQRSKNVAGYTEDIKVVEDVQSIESRIKEKEKITNIERSENIAGYTEGIKVIEDVQSVESRTKEKEKTTNIQRSKNVARYNEDIKGLTSPTVDDRYSLSDENINIAPIINKEVIQEVSLKKPATEKKKEIESVNDSSRNSKTRGNAKVRRALLTIGLKDKEPINKVVSPIVISMVKEIKLYYFTEILNMEGKSLYHQWIWEGQILFKREIKISSGRWRASTNKLIPYSKPGLWKVNLVNNEGDILNEIKFEVVNK